MPTMMVTRLAGTQRNRTMSQALALGDHLCLQLYQCYRQYLISWGALMAAEPVLYDPLPWAMHVYIVLAQKYVVHGSCCTLRSCVLAWIACPLGGQALSSNRFRMTSICRWTDTISGLTEDDGATDLLINGSSRSHLNRASQVAALELFCIFCAEQRNGQ